MDQGETVALLRLIRQGWPEQAIDPDAVEFWHGAMEDVPFAEAKAALRAYSRTAKFKPVPAELRELIATAAVAPSLIPEEAWAEVRSEARRVGFNRPPTFHRGVFHREEPRFSSPLIERAVQAVGWETICTGNNERGFIRDQFVKALAAIARHEVKRAQAGEATGTDPVLPEGVTAIGRGAAD
jgi:hypothetical protein